MISALCRKSKFEFRTFLEKIQILGFSWCSTRDDLSIDVSIINVGLILTKLWCLYSNFAHGQATIKYLLHFLHVSEIYCFTTLFKKKSVTIFATLLFRLFNQDSREAFPTWQLDTITIFTVV